VQKSFTRSGERSLPGARIVPAALTRAFGFLGVVLALALAVAAAPSANTGVRTGPPAVQTDRSVKLDLIAKLTRGPEILILGDSRGRQAEPSVLQRLTGHTGFNAAVTGGSAPDAWVFTRYTDDQFPGQKHRYIWFVSAGLTTNIVDPRLRADRRGQRYLRDVAAYLSPQTISVPPHTDTQFRADGSVPHGRFPSSPGHAKKLESEVAKAVAEIRRNPPVAPTFDPKRFELFEQVLTYMHAHGARPVIVLNPVHPAILAELEKYGMPLWTTSLDYLRRLQARLDFVVVDCRDIRAWGGSADDFTNPTHVNWRNMRRMLRYIVAHSAGALS
jgi:hypothetical protein